jgi:hypothetical protein
LRYFCTYFDRNYAPYGLALYRSLARQIEAFRLYVLCYDEPTARLIEGLKDNRVVPVPIAELERHDPALVDACRGRTLVERYFTGGPCWIRYAMELSNAPLMTYLDSDLYFFSDPAPIFDELGDGSVLIVEHRTADREQERRVGIYNVGLISFRNDARGRACLDWWRERCLEWCYNRVEDDRFADQKYLEDFPKRFAGVVVLQHPGAGLAPWNVSRFNLQSNGKVTVDGRPLIVYHFTLFYRIARGLYYLSVDDYGGKFSDTLRRDIYVPYIKEVEALARDAQVAPGRAYNWRDFVWLLRRGKSVSLMLGADLWTIRL